MPSPSETSDCIEANWQRRQMGTLTGARQIPLRHAFLPAAGAKAAVVILHGHAECLEKYKELAWDFNRRGYSVHLYDQRGHGGSGREIKLARTSHVESFADFTEDLRLFLEERVSPQHSLPLHLFAHSMGGAVAVDFLQRYPGSFDKVVLNAPMLGIKPPLITDGISQSFARILDSIPGLGKLRAPGARTISTSADYLELKTTHCQRRFETHWQFLRENPELAIDPASTTIHFGAEAYRHLSKIMVESKVRRILNPILLLQAADEDFVSNESQELYARWAPNCELTRLSEPDFRPFHELYFEVDSFRSLFLETLFAFLDPTQEIKEQT